MRRVSADTYERYFLNGDDVSAMRIIGDEWAKDHPIFWLEEEFDMIRKMAGKMSVGSIADRLNQKFDRNRTIDSVRGCAVRLKISLTHTRFNWSSEEVEMLRSLAGHESTRVISERLNTKFKHNRTESSTAKRASELGIDLVVNDYTKDNVARMLGVAFVSVQTWLDNGMIHARRISDRKHSYYRFTKHEIEEFVRKYPHAYSWMRIRDRHLRALAKSIYDADPWVDAFEAGEILGVHWTTVKKHCNRGTLPGFMGLHPSKRVVCRLVKVSDLNKFKPIRAHPVGNHNRKSSMTTKKEAA